VVWPRHDDADILVPARGMVCRVHNLLEKLLMSFLKKCLWLSVFLLIAVRGQALILFSPTTVRPPINHIVVVILENANASDAMAQPFMASLITNGTYLNNYHAIAHPSQPNYIAMEAAQTAGVVDDTDVNLAVSHLGDLVESAGKNWKIYSEGWPGSCYTGTQSGNYVRKHNPFISFNNVRTNSTRCNAHVVDSSVLNTDITNGTLPAYALYVPDLQNDGHDTSVTFADTWLSGAFGPRLSNPAFMNNTLFIVTFDENDSTNDTDMNTVYMVMYGARATPGVNSSTLHDHYSLMRLVEDTFSLGNLGLNDATASIINELN